jgi:UDP-glucose 4-epimerase
MNNLEAVNSSDSSENAKMHILITGANSFIGSTVAKWLANTGYGVTATFRGKETSATNTIAKLYSNVEFVPLDVGNKSTFGNLPARVDAVIHMAAHAPSSGASIEEMLFVNTIGTNNILQYAIEAGAQRIIFLSSLSVHGDVEGLIIDENTPIKNPTFYGATKYLGERIFFSASEAIPAIAIRLPGVVGSGAFRSWMPNLVQQLQASLPIEIVGAGMPFNSVIHVSDIASLIVALLKKPLVNSFQAFPIAASGQILIRGVVDYLHRQLQSRSSIVIKSEKSTYQIVSSKYAADLYGFSPMTVQDVLSKYCSEILASG